MSWLLRLYPAAWQRRFRREVAAHLANEPMKLRTALDLVAGAVDAWVHPEWIPNPTQQSTGEHQMIKAARCGSTDISKPEAMRSAAWMIGVSLVLTVVGVILDKTVGPHITIDALLLSAFFIALTISSRPTFLKPYSAVARNMITGVSIVGWYLFFLLVSALGNIM